MVRGSTRALYAANALAVLEAPATIRGAGLSFPEDVAVVDYDKTYVVALGSVCLTSVGQPRHEKGILAARLLLERIEPGSTEPSLEVLEPRRPLDLGAPAPLTPARHPGSGDINVAPSRLDE